VSEGRNRIRYYYPVRAVEQLMFVAQAKWIGLSRWPRIRHWVWMRGGHLEDWSLWRQDRVREALADPEIAALARTELSANARDAVVTRAARLIRRRSPLGPLSARYTFMSLLFGLVCEGTQSLGVPHPESLGLDPTDHHDREHFRDRVRSALTEPVDGAPGEEVRGDTLGDVLAKGFPIDWAALHPAMRRDEAVLSLIGFLPHPAEVVELLGDLTERDALQGRHVLSVVLGPGERWDDMLLLPLPTALAIVATLRMSARIPADDGDYQLTT
jgi:hypothetical protein